MVQFRNPETNEVLAGDKITSPEFAADELTRFREEKAKAAQDALDAEMAAAVDQVRGQELQPGFVQGPDGQQHPIEQTYQPTAEVQPEAALPETDLDRALASVTDPAARTQLIQALSEHVQQVEAVKHQYAQAATQTLLQGEALLLSQAPELADVPRDQRLLALQMLEKQNPQRGAQIRAIDREIGRHLEQQGRIVQAAQQEQQQRQAQAFAQWAKGQDAAYEKTAAGQTAAERADIAAEVMNILHEDGVTDAQAAFMWNNDPTFRSALSQKTLLREARARIAARSVRRQKIVPIPHVQRPGVSESIQDRSEYASLERSLRGKPLSAKEAAKLLIARRG